MPVMIGKLFALGLLALSVSSSNIITMSASVDSNGNQIYMRSMGFDIRLGQNEFYAYDGTLFGYNVAGYGQQDFLTTDFYPSHLYTEKRVKNYINTMQSSHALDSDNPLHLGYLRGTNSGPLGFAYYFDIFLTSQLYYGGSVDNPIYCNYLEFAYYDNNSVIDENFAITFGGHVLSADTDFGYVFQSNTFSYNEDYLFMDDFLIVQYSSRNNAQTLLDAYLENITLRVWIGANYSAGFQTGFQQGYSNGSKDGYGQGYADGLAMSEQGSFHNLFNSIADTPLRFLYGLFNFDLFGTSMLVIVLTLLTAIVFFAVFKKFWR